MAYREKGQNKFFDYLEKMGKMPRRKMIKAMSDNDEFEKPGMFHGGRVAPGVGEDMQDDDLELWADMHYGLDDEREGYACGGVVDEEPSKKRSFVKALRMNRR